MSWWGKLLGGTFGYMIGGPIGALIGAALGHKLDRGVGGSFAEQERIQATFFTTTFSVMGHIAKADGNVSPSEIQLAQAVMDQMQLSPEQRKMAQKFFYEGKAEDFPLDDVLDQFRETAHRRTNLLRMFLEIMIQAATIDGEMHPAEQKMLHHISDRLGFSPGVYAQIEKMIRATSGAYSSRGGRSARSDHFDLDQAYAILAVSSDASDSEVKRAYRKLMNQHHPDKLVAKGLPEEMMKMAAQKTHEIRQAYETIKAARDS